MENGSGGNFQRYLNSRFAALAERLAADPGGVHREDEARLIEARGQEWYAANQRYHAADWQFAMFLLGYSGPG